MWSSVLKTFEDLSGWIFPEIFLQALENAYFHFSPIFVYKSTCNFSCPLILIVLKKWWYVSLWVLERYIQTLLFFSWNTHCASGRQQSVDVDNEALLFWEQFCHINLRNPDCNMVCPRPFCSSQGITILLGPRNQISLSNFSSVLIWSSSSNSAQFAKGIAAKFSYVCAILWCFHFIWYFRLH